ncbi:MAG: hypothetical protein ACRC9H_09235, partial [Aeromonas veronii]
MDTLSKPAIGLTDFPTWRERVNQAQSTEEVDAIAKEIEEAKATPPKQPEPAPKQQEVAPATSVSPTQENASESVTGPSKEDIAAANERRKVLRKRKDIKGTPTDNILRGINLHNEAGYNRFLELEKELASKKEEPVTPTPVVEDNPVVEDIPVQEEIPAGTENDYQNFDDEQLYEDIDYDFGDIQQEWDNLQELDFEDEVEGTPKTAKAIQEEFDDYVGGKLNTEDEKVIERINGIRSRLVNAPSNANLNRAKQLVDLALMGKSNTPQILDNARKANIRGHIFNRLKNTFTLKGSSIFNYMSNMAQQMGTYLDDTADMAERQKVADILATYLDREPSRVTIEKFMEFHDQFANALNDVLKYTDNVKDTPYEYSNWLNDFRLADNTLNPDMVMSMAAGAFTYIQENAKDTLYNRHSAIDKMVNKSRLTDPLEGEMIPLKPESGRLPAELYEKLTNVGIPRNLMHRNLGKAIVAATGLNLKYSANYNASMQLESSTGLAAYEALKHMGMVHETEFSRNDLYELAGVTLQTGVTPKGKLVSAPAFTEADKGIIIPNVGKLIAVKFSDKLTEENEHVLDDTIQSIVDVEDKSLVRDLFKLEPTKASPAKTPKTFTESLQVRGRKFTKTFRDIFNKLNATEREHDSGMSALLDMGGKNLILRAAGWENTKGLIGALASSAKDRNQGLERELNDYIEFKELGLDTFHLTVSPWSNGRYGWNEYINPQTSKIHREFVKQKAFQQKVNIKGDNKGDPSKRKFLLTVGAGLGINQEKDANHSKALRETLRVLTQDGPIKTAIDTLTAAILENRSLTTAEENIVMAGVKAGKEGVHSLAAINTVARYNIAKENRDTVFTHSLVGEVDGKTNGTAILHTFFAPEL